MTKYTCSCCDHVTMTNNRDNTSVKWGKEVIESGNWEMKFTGDQDHSIHYFYLTCTHCGEVKGGTSRRNTWVIHLHTKKQYEEFQTYLNEKFNPVVTQPG